MKKKWLVAAGCLIVAVATVFAMVFLVSTAGIPGHTDPKTGEERVRAALTGSWRVVSVENTVCRDTYMIFEDGVLSQMENGQVISSCMYEITSSGHIVPASGAEEYIAEIVSDDYVKLIGTMSSAVYNLIKQPPQGQSAPEFNAGVLIGDWEVLVHGGTAVSGETLIFTADTIALYVDDGETPYFSSRYHYPGGETLSASDLSMEMDIVWLAEGHMCLVERKTGYVWEISKKQ